MPKKSSKRDNLQLELNSKDVKGNKNQPGKGVPLQSPGSPVGEDLVGLRYIDDVGSKENLLGPGLQETGEPKPVAPNKNDPVSNGPQTAPEVHPDTEPDVVEEPQDATETQALIPPVTVQPGTTTVCPPGLECLLEEGQLVVHMGKLRQDLVVNEDAVRRMEVVDPAKHVLFHVEEDETLREESDTDKSFHFRLYNRDKVEVMQVYSPHNTSCVCCGATWHCLKRCKFQAIVYCPPGVVVGFVKRSQTRFVQEYQILNAQEKPLLTLRGGAQDLEIYSLDLESELGRMSVHGWVGVMHEVRRTAGDWGLTFPIDLDVQVKASLLGAVFAIDWILRTKGGKKKSQPAQTKIPKEAKKKEKKQKEKTDSPKHTKEKKKSNGAKAEEVKDDKSTEKDSSKEEQKEEESKEATEGKDVAENVMQVLESNAVESITTEQEHEEVTDKAAQDGTEDTCKKQEQDEIQTQEANASEERDPDAQEQAVEEPEEAAEKQEETVQQQEEAIEKPEARADTIPLIELTGPDDDDIEVEQKESEELKKNDEIVENNESVVQAQEQDTMEENTETTEPEDNEDMEQSKPEEENILVIQKEEDKNEDNTQTEVQTQDAVPDDEKQTETKIIKGEAAADMVEAKEATK